VFICVSIGDTITGRMMETRILASAGVESRCCLCFYEWTSSDIFPEGRKCCANTVTRYTFCCLLDEAFWLTMFLIDSWAGRVSYVTDLRPLSH